MATEAVTILAEDSDNVLLAGPEGHLALLVKVFPAANGALRLPDDPETARFLTTYLRATRSPLLRRLGTSVFGNPRWNGDLDHWMDCTNPGELATVLSAHMVYGAVDSTFWRDHGISRFTGNSEIFERYPNPVRALRALLESGGIVENHLAVKIYPNFQPLTTHILHARSNLPEVRGLFKHPIYGDVGTDWIVASPPRCEASPDFPHLKTLFSSFELPPVDEFPLLAFLLGCFHVDSLYHPHPVLFVDSYMQGRGKGEIGRVLTLLLDNRQSTLTLSRTEGPQADEEITAHLAKGGRCLSLQNVTGVSEWNSSLLACLATDGAVNKRIKFKAETTPFEGIVGMGSMVYGEGSLHKDIISRIWRVYLPGEAVALDPKPDAYAKTHRQEILAEILLAHELAPEYNLPPVGRFEAFERRAAAAYCAVAGTTPEEARALLAAATRGAWGLSDSAVRLLYRKSPEAFFSTVKDVVSGFQASDTKLDLEGARALGLIYSQGEWHDET